MTTHTKDLLVLADTLESFNKWRRGDDDYPEMLNPKTIGEAVDKAIAIIRTSATSAPKKPLTNKQIDAIGATVFKAEFLDKVEVAMNRDLVRKAEAAHGIDTTPKPAESCTWLESDPWGVMPSEYEASCGELWSFTEGGPVENSVKFCHGCGKPVLVEPFTPQHAEGETP